MFANYVINYFAKQVKLKQVTNAQLEMMYKQWSLNNSPQSNTPIGELTLETGNTVWKRVQWVKNKKPQNGRDLRCLGSLVLRSRLEKHAAFAKVNDVLKNWESIENAIDVLAS